MNSVERAGDRPHGERILLVMGAGRDRDLLQEWLATQPQYDVLACDPGAPLPGQDEYDLCILNEVALERSRSDLIAHQEAADPSFLPCLLITADDAAAEATTRSLGEKSGDQTLVDDIISLPVEQATLQRRIENFLEARRAFVRLREREQQYEELVDLAPEAILILRDRDIVYSNAAAAEIFAGDDSGDLEEQSILSFVPDADRDALAECLRTIEDRSRTEEFHSFTMRTTSGESIRVEVTGARITFGNDPATQLLIRDVTEEYDRRQRLDLFGRAIQMANQGITIADARQEDVPLIYANDAFEEITGYSTADSLGRNCRFLQGEETDEETVARIRKAIDESDPVAVEVLNYRKDGTPFWNQLDIVPVTDGEGKVTHFLGLQRDITRRKAREERLQVLGRVLRHNLRNRMNVVTGHAERLQSADDPDVVAAAATIERAAERLLEISEQVHNFTSLIDDPQHELDTYDIADVLARVTNGFRSEYPDATVRLDSPETATVLGHRLLPAALGEFLELAVSDGGPAPDIEIGVRLDEEWATIELRDRGGTVPQSELAILAEERETPTDHPEGMELWLMRWAVLNSNGEVSVADEGVVRVTIRLHRSDDDPSTAVR